LDNQQGRIDYEDDDDDEDEDDEVE